MTMTFSTRKRQFQPRPSFSMISGILAVVAVASSLAYVHAWGKQAIPFVEWVCGSSAVLLLISLIVDSRRP
ncbi:hypothetical protein [Dyella japonica]|uniref:Uncharacterized protein n=1 Tax=Dyella japonica TaxID=231455 RepID=A0ABV2JP60_9GAMM